MLSDSDESGFSECSSLSYEEAPLTQATQAQGDQDDYRAIPQKPETMPLINGEYSIAPDMLFGWKPKHMGIGSPIPLDFTLDEAPVCVNTATGAEYPTIYHGYRPRDSLVMHRAFSGPSSYPFQFSATYIGVNVGKRDTRDFIGMNPHRLDDLTFDSRFESGNLDRVIKIKAGEYDLYMRADANTNGHNQWYFFKVSSKLPQTVKFTIVNFTKSDSLYSQGMQPCIYSKQACASGRSSGWERGGDHVQYSYSKIARFCPRRRNYWQLSFSYTILYSDDEVSFAYAIPYTYSKLTHLITEFKQTVPEKILQVGSLCKSLSGVDVPLLTVSEFPIVKPKSNIVINCRVHPGETHASWMLEGLLRFLISSEECAQQLRSRFVFHVIPMLNPDGVILGNYRSCFAGNDLNRKYKSPDSRLHPTVFHIKSLLIKAKAEGGLFTFLDLHAHSRKKNVFIYGPHFPLHSGKYYKMRVFPKLLSERTEMFRYFGCKFRNDRSKKKAARLVVCKEHKLPYSYTLEASFYGYLTSQRTTTPFNEELLMKMGKAVCEALYDYALLLENERDRKKKKRFARMRQRKRRAEVETEGLNYSSQRRTLKSILRNIRQEAAMERENDSGGSDSDVSADELNEHEQKRIHNLIYKAIDDFAVSGERPVRQAAISRQRLTRKLIDGNLEARSNLSKYFSRAASKELKDRKKTAPLRTALHADASPVHRKNPTQSLNAVHISKRLSLSKTNQGLKHIQIEERTELRLESRLTRGLGPLSATSNVSPQPGYGIFTRRLDKFLEEQSGNISCDQSPNFSTEFRPHLRALFNKSSDSPIRQNLTPFQKSRPRTKDSNQSSSHLRLYGRRTHQLPSFKEDSIAIA